MACQDSDTARLIDVELDESVGRGTPDVEHERAVAIFDLVEENSFRPVGDSGEGPYKLKLSLVEARLVFAISRENGEAVVTHILSLTPFRRIVKDYFLICESYYDAIRSATPSQIEAIDMGRRGLHNEGSQTLMDRLKDKIDVDFDTARRLFTLVCVLHWRADTGHGCRPGGSAAMSAGATGKPLAPQSVLFLCGMNAIRSPMAEALARQILPSRVFLASAGLRAGERDPFVDAVLDEKGLSLGERQPQSIEELADTNFDLIITLSPEAHHRALDMTRTIAADVEYWPTMDPTVVSGTRDQIIAAYRDVRDRLAASIAQRFET